MSSNNPPHHPEHPPTAPQHGHGPQNAHPQQPHDPHQPVHNTPVAPVAYDEYGRPLYHHPPQPKYPQVRMAKAHKPQGISKDTKRHFELNLSKDEVLLREVRRHPITVFGIIFAGLFTLAVIIFLAASVIMLANNPPEGVITQEAFPQIPSEIIIIGAFGLGVLTIVFTLVALHVNRGNRFYVTNESVIQRIQNSLFHVQKQQISLANIEDVTFDKQGILQHIFNYGTVRMSTEGDETTYLFKFSPEPQHVANHVINAQEAFTTMMPDHKFKY